MKDAAPIRWAVPLWLAVAPALITLALPTVPPVWLARPPVLAVLLASVWALVGYVRLRRRGLMAMESVAPILTALVPVQVVVLFWLDAGGAAPLAGPELACLWRLSAAVFPAAAHGRFWWWLSLGLVIILLVALAN